MSIEFNEIVDLEPILIRLGFVTSFGGLQYDLGYGKLNASKITNWVNEVYKFHGSYRTERSRGEIQFDLPLKVESYEQAVALLAFHLKKEIFIKYPEWIDKGLEWQDLLPWKKEQKKYQENPKAFIEYDWFRIITTKLREAANNAMEDDFTTITFDGAVLKCQLKDSTLVCSGTGKAWTEKAVVKTKSFNFLSKKVPKRGSTLFIWQNRLHINNRVFG